MAAASMHQLHVSHTILHTCNLSAISKLIKRNDFEVFAVQHHNSRPQIDEQAKVVALGQPAKRLTLEGVSPKPMFSS